MRPTLAVFISQKLFAPENLSHSSREAFEVHKFVSLHISMSNEYFTIIIIINNLIILFSNAGYKDWQPVRLMWTYN